VTDAGASSAELSPRLHSRIQLLLDEGWAIWQRFDLEVRQSDWHPFVPADYERVLEALLRLRTPGARFLEWGSATGVVAIMADMLGFEAFGIELDAGLVETARELASRHGSAARFAAGSFLPAGYRWRPKGGDARLATIGQGMSAYPELGHPLEDFDVVYGYPWSGEEPIMRDVMASYGRRDALLLIHGGREGVRIYGGKGNRNSRR
jgi:hypothetical protein